MFNPQQIQQMEEAKKEKINGGAQLSTHKTRI